MATFEHLPARVGGLAEAVTSLGEALSREKEDEIYVFMPAHGLTDNPDALFLEHYADFSITVGSQIHPVRVMQGRRHGVRLFLFSNPVLDHPEIYHPRDLLLQKMAHFSKALPGLINLLIKKEQRKPDILHIHDWHCVFAGALVKKYFRIPLVFTIHRLSGERISPGELSAVHSGEPVDTRCLEGEMFNIELFGAYQCDYLTTVSYSYLDEEWPNFFSLFPGKSTYVWNGVDYKFWDPFLLTDADLSRSERRRRILEQNGLEQGCLFFCVGRLDAGQKGIDVLLHAFEMLLHCGVKEIKEDRSTARLILVGTGDPFLESEARRLALRYPGRVKAEISYLGRESTREIFGAADFCLIPSDFEPFGLAPLEAMSMGCLPIGSRVGGIQDTVLDIGAQRKKATGWLVPRRDPQALACAMADAARRLIEEPAQIEQMRANGRLHVVEHFSWEQAARRYRQVYRETVTLKLSFVTYAEPY
jgi:starch synthase